MERKYPPSGVKSLKTQYGRLRSDKSTAMLNFKYIALGITMCLLPVAASVLLGLGLGFEEFFGESFLPFILIMSPCIGFGIWFLTKPIQIDRDYAKFQKQAKQDISWEQKAWENFEKQHPHWEAEYFYLDLREAGFDTKDKRVTQDKLLSFISEKNIKVNCDNKNLVYFYDLGRVETMRTEEKELQSEHEYYSKCFGADKLSVYCKKQIQKYQEIIKKCDKEAEEIKKSSESFYNISKQQEHDWAVHGGIASGIAGVGAGVATAINVESKNQQIREDNQNLAHFAASAYLMRVQPIWNKKSDAQNEEKYWIKELNRSKKRIIEKSEAEKLFKKIKIKVLSYKTTETGSVSIELEITTKEKLTVENNKLANIDGSFLITVKSGDKVLGSTVCSLPYAGIGDYEIVKCVCTDIKTKENDLQFKFDCKPDSLWLVEK